MPTAKTIYKCRVCGCPNYQRVIDRIAGALRPTGQFKCTGCRNIFDTLRAFWEPQRNNDFLPSKFSGG